MTKDKIIKAIKSEKVKPLNLECLIKWKDSNDTELANIAYVDYKDYESNEFGENYPFDGSITYYIYGTPSSAVKDLMEGADFEVVEFIGAYPLS